jgi:hypothetical protein
MKLLAQQIGLRFFARATVASMIGIQLVLVVIFLTAGQMTQASSAFTLAVWMFLALVFESKAHNLKEEKENLLKFLNSPAESEGGEA